MSRTGEVLFGGSPHCRSGSVSMSSAFQASKEQSTQVIYNGRQAPTAPREADGAQHREDLSVDGLAPNVRSVPVDLSPRSPLFPFDECGSAAAQQYRLLRRKI